MAWDDSQVRDVDRFMKQHYNNCKETQMYNNNQGQYNGNQNNNRGNYNSNSGGGSNPNDFLNPSSIKRSYKNNQTGEKVVGKFHAGETENTSFNFKYEDAERLIHKLQDMLEKSNGEGLSITLAVQEKVSKRGQPFPSGNLMIFPKKPNENRYPDNRGAFNNNNAGRRDYGGQQGNGQQSQPPMNGNNHTGGRNNYTAGPNNRPQQQNHQPDYQLNNDASFANDDIPF